MSRHSLILALALSTVSGMAMAQTAPVSPAPPAGTAPMAATAATTGGGIRVANTATVGLKFVTVKPADFMSTKLIGADVYNNQNEKLGDVQDLVIENGKTITGVVVSVGGFLGMGESYVVLDPTTVVLNQKDNAWRVYVDTSKDNLKNAPKFTYTKKA